MKKSRKKIKVMVFGVFDLLHPGHLDFFMQAKELGDKLIVSVARDLNVFKIKGQKPVQNEKLRLKHITLLPVVDRVVLGGLRDPMPHIKKENPDIIALGYDQKNYLGTDDKKGVQELEKILHDKGLSKVKVVQLKPHWPQIYKSKIIRKNLEK